MKGLKNPQRVYNRHLSEHVNYWFHTERFDELAPCNTVEKFNNKLIEYLNKWKLKLSLPETKFRRYMCEAVCTMYIAYKQGTGLIGPHSEQPRPYDWTDHKESSWRDYLSYHYFNSEFWTRFWGNIPEAAWEIQLPEWRNSIQAFVSHYVSVRSDVIDDTLINEDEYKGHVSAANGAAETDNDL